MLEMKIFLTSVGILQKSTHFCWCGCARRHPKIEHSAVRSRKQFRWYPFITISIKVSMTCYRAWCSDGHRKEPQANARSKEG